MQRSIGVLALVFALLSLGLNVFLIARLNQGRVAALDTLDHASQQLDTLPDLTIRYTARVHRNFSFAGEMPIDRDFTVPISMTVPVNNQVNVSANTPLGPMSIPINVNMNFPFKTQMTVPISMTVPYSVTVPIDLDVPVEIPLRDLGILPNITEMKQEIQKLRSALQ